MCRAVHLEESRFALLLCSEHRVASGAVAVSSVEVFRVVQTISCLQALQSELNIASQADGELPAGGAV